MCKFSKLKNYKKLVREVVRGETRVFSMTLSIREKRDRRYSRTELKGMGDYPRYVLTLCSRYKADPVVKKCRSHLPRETA